MLCPIIIDKSSCECNHGIINFRHVKFKIPACFPIASELCYKEFRAREYSALDKELFIRKPIGNEELIKEIKRLIRD
jgi:hypothetical protein